MNTSADATESPVTAGTGPGNRARPLSRPGPGRMLAGVACGIARYLNIDAIVVRIAFVVAVFAGGLGIPVYLACWLLIPDERAVESIAGDFVSSMNAWRN
jgi:phage shock protein PspC (stress-responsive transcriptional regulator)